MYPARAVLWLTGLALLMAMAALALGCGGGTREPTPTAETSGSTLNQTTMSTDASAREASGRPGITQVGVSRYNRDCAACHGVRGDRIPAVPLHARQFLEDRGEARLIQVVNEGKGLMPAWSRPHGGKLSEGEINAIVKYILAVSEDVSVEIPTTVAARASGDASAQPTPARPAATPTSERLNPPPDVAHRVEGRENMCLQCHGLDAAYPYPVGHLGRSLVSCLWCHQLGGPPPAVTHDLKQRQGWCGVCHGLTAIVPYPANHAGRRDDSCTQCHDPATTAAGTVAPSRVPRLRNHPASVAAVGCLSCHKPGAGAPLAPANHSGVTDPMCLLCHQADFPTP